MMKRRALAAASVATSAVLLYSFLFSAILLSIVVASGNEEAATSDASSAAVREMQSISTDFLDSNSAATIQAMEKHLFSPEVQSSIQRIFNSRVQHEGKVFHYGSLKYTMEGFWRNWKRMMIDGIPSGSSSVGSGYNSRGKFVLFAGDDKDREVTIIHGKDHKPIERKVKIQGYEYGLANMAVFLSQAMVGGIFDDTCDELNEQPQELRKKDEFGNPIVVHPISNSCGQYNQNYQEMTCLASEQNMQCPQISPATTIQSTFNAKAGQRGLMCGPVGTYPEEAQKYKNDFGRIDVEQCCFWGRGPLQAKGLCSMGKLNYYIGSRALAEGRISRSTSGVFPDINFCSQPQRICEANSADGSDTEDLRWTVAMFEFAERVQRYSDENWDYKEKLVEFVNSGMNINEFYPFKLDHSFIHAVSSIVDRGCHDAPNCLPFEGEVNKFPQRREALTIALSALQIPKFRKEQIMETTMEYMRSKKSDIEENLLRYKRQSSTILSERYKFDDFLRALTRMSEEFDSPDHSPFYMGSPWMRDGHKYGLGNIALFLANGIELGIERDDTCDELNEYRVSGKFALSNSCGQQGLSYQDLTCDSRDVPDMACRVDPNMFITAVTYDRTLGAPPALQCGPRSRIPFTGYWDEAENAESEGEAFANQNGRIDIEGCCWWGRGFLQMKGPCDFGRLNYYMGARAARENRPSLYSDVDFCEMPEAICGSQYRHELVWTSALFKWIDKVQNYQDGEWNYLEQLQIFADNAFEDDVFIKEVNAIVKVGCRHPPCEEAGCVSFPCDGAYSEDENRAVTRAFVTFSVLGIWQNFDKSLGGTNSPTPVPSICPECTGKPTLLPTVTPTASPLIDVTSQPSEAPSREITVLLRRYNELKEHLITRRRLLQSKVFVSETKSGQLVSSKLYTLDGLLSVLKDLATKGSDDGSGSNLMFYTGQDDDKNVDYGLTNVALFLAHATTRGLRYDTCEEVNNHLIGGKLPISNSCGQHSQSYNEDICPMTDIAKECPIDPKMNVKQASVGTSSAPPFFCSPKSQTPYTGYFNPSSGRTESDKPFANAIGRQDVEGCCWWGRGMLHTSGICDLGRFNYMYGLPAFKDGRPSARYNIDFCINPEALCSDFTIPSSEFNKFPTTISTSDVRYLLGMFYWMSSVQGFNWGYWNYMDKLKLFVDGGMTDDSFVDEFSDIVLDSSRDGPLRKSSFKRILEIFFSGEQDVSSPSGSSTSVVPQLPSVESIADADLPSLDTEVDEVQTPNNLLPPPLESIAVAPQITPPVSPPTILLEPDFTESDIVTTMSPVANEIVDAPPSPPFLNSVFEYSSGCSNIYSFSSMLWIFITPVLHYYLR